MITTWPWCAVNRILIWLRWQKTNGVNHGIDNAALIAKIEQWQQRCDLELWGCRRDWLQLYFTRCEPKYNFDLGASNEKCFAERKLWEERIPNFKEFAGGIIKFGPNVVGQVYRNKTELINAMKQTNTPHLWWD